MAGAASQITLDRLTETELRAWRALARAQVCLVKRIDTEMEAAHGLPLSSFEVLGRLADAEGGKLRMHDIADSVMLSRSGLTRLVDRLERDGLVCRCSCENDARGAYAVITDPGRERLAEARVAHRAAVRELFVTHYSEEELETLAPLLERLIPPGGCCKT